MERATYPEVTSHNVFSASIYTKEVLHYILETEKDGESFLQMYPKAYFTLESATKDFIGKISRDEPLCP